MPTPSSSDRCPSALAKPVIASIALVLPAPLGPMSPTMPPAGTRSDRSSTATTPPYRTVGVLDLEHDAERRRRGGSARPP